MRLTEIIANWLEARRPKLHVRLHIFGEDAVAISNSRKVHAFFIAGSNARWMGDIFDNYIEIRKTGDPPHVGSRENWIERLDAGDPEFFTKLEAHLREP